MSNPMNYPKLMTDEARRLHALWMDCLPMSNWIVDPEFKEQMIGSIAAAAYMCGIPSSSGPPHPISNVEQVWRFANGECVICGMTRGERGRYYGRDGNSYCPVECEGYDPLDRAAP